MLLAILYMGGVSILGELNAFKSGHALNNILLREVFKQTESWEWANLRRRSASTYYVPRGWRIKLKIKRRTNI